MKVDCCVDLAQQMILGNNLFQTHKLDLISVFDIVRKHVYHPYLLYHIFASFTRKRSPVGDLFRQAEAKIPEWGIFALYVFVAANRMVFVKYQGGKIC